MISVPDALLLSYLSGQKIVPLLAEILHRNELRNCQLFPSHVCLGVHDCQHVALKSQSSCHIPAQRPMDKTGVTMAVSNKTNLWD